MKKKSIVIIVSLLLTAGVVFQARSLLLQRKAQIQNQPLPQAQTINVTLVSPKNGTLVTSKEFLATIASDRAITLSTKLTGYINKIFVEESQYVKKGDLLVTIDQSEILSTIHALKATLAMQEADLQVAKESFKRNQKLYAAGGLSKERLDQSKVLLDTKSAIAENTKQKIAQLEHQRSYLRIVAPFSGRVDTIVLHEGDLAVAGKPIIMMHDTKQKLLFSFAQKSNSIAAGNTVLYHQAPIGSVRTVYATANNGLSTAEVALEKKLTLPIGAQINISVITKKTTGCIVPNDTLVHNNGLLYIMRYDNGTFKPLAVTLKAHNDYNSVIVPCPKTKIARSSERKLALLPAYSHVRIIGNSNE